MKQHKEKVDHTPPVCDYEGSDYQTRFWERGGREYEDRCEAIALKRLLPRSGELMLELGAGAGRNTSRYAGFKKVVLVDYSQSQLRQARDRLGSADRFTYVSADIYKLPFRDHLFDAATMIRTLHHMVDARAALHQVSMTLQPGGKFILEYANKKNLKAILRYLLRRQTWNPFTLDQVEFAPLNFDFHPRMIKQWLGEEGFSIDSELTVSHFRVAIFKKTIPVGILTALDSVLQWTAPILKFSPSIFLRAHTIAGEKSPIPLNPQDFFRCILCGEAPLIKEDEKIVCPACGSNWRVVDGIYDFRKEDA